MNKRYKLETRLQDEGWMSIGCTHDALEFIVNEALSLDSFSGMVRVLNTDVAPGAFPEVLVTFPAISPAEKEKLARESGIIDEKGFFHEEKLVAYSGGVLVPDGSIHCVTGKNFSKIEKKSGDDSDSLRWGRVVDFG